MHVIVLGLGGVGAMAAWRLSAAGYHVTALEQYRIDHDLGSSFGDSRIVRRVYPNALYTRMMGRAYELWEALMIDSGDHELFVRCGGLFIGDADNPELNAAEASLSESGVSFERLDAADCMGRYPAFHLASNETALYEPSMGYARASRAVRAAVQLASRFGATIREDCPIVRIDGASDRVCVTTASGEQIEADRLVMAPGPWASPILSELGVKLPVKVTRQPYIHLGTARNEESFAVGRFPAWIDADTNAYGFPILGDVPGVKIGIHNFGEEATPETVRRTVSEAERDEIRRYAARRFPWLGPNVCYEKVCLYTATPDNDFVIDTVPGAPQIMLISACSGHGFKFTPLMGQFAVDFASGKLADHDLSPFSLSRFVGND